MSSRCSCIRRAGCWGSDVIGAILAGVLAAAALAILGKRLVDFIRTGGESACRNCPYSGQCGGKCKKGK